MMLNQQSQQQPQQPQQEQQEQVLPPTSTAAGLRRLALEVTVALLHFA